LVQFRNGAKAKRIQMTIKRAAFGVGVGVAIAFMAVAIGGYLGFSAPPSNLDSFPAGKIWNAVSCRIGLYVQKAQGGVPELSWTDLWEITRLRQGFHCVDGVSMTGSLQYSSIASKADRQEGARIFRARCTGCHGLDGSGGPVGPSLIRSGYIYGDSDMAIYRVLRNGIPGTPMPSADLPLRKLLEVTAYLKMLTAHSGPAVEPERPRLAVEVNSARLQAAGTGADGWLMYSGSYNGWRHTTLNEITPANVAQLRIRWIKQFDVDNSNCEATPLVTNGAIFIVPDASHVLALDAKTGDVIWQYTRAIAPGVSQLNGPVNRGLAVYGSTLFLGTLDGYLVAINANDGTVLWQTLVAKPSEGYSITGAPLTVNHSVIVGIAAGEYAARGFLAAYDAATGKQQWRFDTIPGPGELGHDTWKNDAWRTGGGGTWVTGSYDPTTDLLYWGVGNPAPAFAGDLRPGDNLFTDSVIALHASTGKLAWYFQFTPHDDHDRDAAQTPVLADLSIGGVAHKAILWPNRNGFYYALDRITGEYLVGVPFVETDWATALTPTGRPILKEAAEVTTAGRSTKPGISGGTNWQNPAFDQGRGTIFVPAIESSSVFTKAAPGAYIGRPGGFYIGSGWSEVGSATHEVLALDAATGRKKWRYAAPPTGPNGGNYSGLLSTGTGLVFGASGGILFALDADTGREIWRLPLGGTTKSAPISFTIGGHQVIAVVAGRALFVLGL
jgi:alcohol dehydrogenase (cytochrome c)